MQPRADRYWPYQFAVLGVMVTGPGGTVGEEILRNPRIRRIAFTGSTPVGRHVMEVAGREIKRVTLELGDSDPMIVMEDALSAA